MFKSGVVVAFVALAALQVALAYPAQKAVKLRGDADDAIAQAVVDADLAQAQAEGALQDVLRAAAIGDLSASQEAANRAGQASQTAQQQADLAKDIAVKAAGGTVRAVGGDVSNRLYTATNDAGRTIDRFLQDGREKLNGIVKRFKSNYGRLPRWIVDLEIMKVNWLSTTASNTYGKILDSSIASSKVKVSGATHQIQIWEAEVSQASAAAQAALVAAQAAAQANAQTTTTPAPTTTTTKATTTQAPATEAPATEAPATEAPATEAPATEAPATEAPATEAPATEAPATEAPANEAPATEAPATQAPATEAPASEAPTTEAPATEAPATEAPATEAPATEAPATEAPATEAPATEAPATEAPATEAPANEDPEPATVDTSLRMKRSTEDDPFATAKRVLNDIVSDYYNYADFVQENAVSVIGDAFGAASSAVDKISKYRSYSGVADAQSKLLNAIHDISDANEAGLKKADLAAKTSYNDLY